jgi:hypothetical protein
MVWSYIERVQLTRQIAHVQKEAQTERSFLKQRERELANADYANHQVTLQTVEGREILRRRTGKFRFGKDRAFAALPVNTVELTRGDYILILFGRTSDGRSEEIDRYFFRVS